MAHVQGPRPFFGWASATRLLAVVVCTVWASAVVASSPKLQIGGSGYALSLDGSTWAGSDSYRLPKNITGIGLTYWLQRSSVTGEAFPQTLFCLSDAFDTCVAEVAHSNSLVYFEFGGTSGTFRIPTVNGYWTHYGLSWNFNNGALEAYVNGSRADISLTQPGSRVNVMLNTTLSAPAATDCFETTGGYAPEGSQCIFPLTLSGVTYNSCVPWTSRQPFIAANDPYRSTLNLGLRQAPWCPTVSSYSPTRAATRRSWGFCSCFDDTPTNGTNTYSEVMSTIGPMVARQLANATVVLIKCTEDLRSMDFATPSLAIIRSENSSSCLTEAIILSYVQKLSERSVEAVIIAANTTINAALVENLDSGSDLPLPVGVSVVEARASDVLPASTIDKCLPIESSLDGDIGTSTSSCSMSYVADIAPPFSTHFGIVVPQGVDASNWSFTLFRTSQETQGDVQVVGRQIGAKLPDSNLTTSSRQYFFSLARLVGDDSRLANGVIHEAFRLEFTPTVPGVCSSFVISEFRLFSANISQKLSSYPQFASGAITERSLFGQGGMKTSKSMILLASTPFSAMIRALERRNGQQISMFDGTAVAPLSSDDKIKLQDELIMSVGRRPGLGIIGSSQDYSTNFTGAIVEDLVLFSSPLTNIRVAASYSTGSTLNSWSRYGFDSVPIADIGASNQPLKLYTLLGEPLRVSSNSNVSSGDSILSYPLPSQSTDFSIQGVAASSGRLKVSLVVQPAKGKVASLAVQYVSSDSRFVVTGTYTTKAGSPVSSSDQFTVQVTENGQTSPANAVVRVVPSLVPFANVTSIVTQFSQDIILSASTSVTTTIGGPIPALDTASKITVVNSTRLMSGALYLAGDCGERLILNSSKTYTGPLAIRYSAAYSANDLLIDSLVLQTVTNPRITWTLRFIIRPTDADRKLLPIVGFESPSTANLSNDNTTMIFGSLLAMPVAFQLVSEPAFGTLIDGTTNTTLASGSVASAFIPSNVFASSVLPICEGTCSTQGSLTRLQQAAGQSDGTGALVDVPGSKLLVTFPVALESVSVTLRVKMKGRFGPVRVFVESSISPLNGKSQACVPFNCSLSADPLASCADALGWVLASQTDCSAVLDDAPDGTVWTDVTFPVCSLGRSLSKLRIDFDTKSLGIANGGWVLVDSISLQGRALGSSQLSSYASTTSNAKVIYMADSGLSGVDFFSFRGMTLSCLTTQVQTRRVDFASGAIFGRLPPILTSSASDQVGFEIPLDLATVLSYLQTNVFRLLSPSDALWPKHTMLLTGVKVVSRSGNIVYQESQDIAASFNTPLVVFSAKGIDGALLAGGNLDLVATVQVNDLPGTAQFLLKSTVVGSCGQASPDLGACSQAGRPFLPPPACVLAEDQGYVCQCYQPRFPDRDIVFAGQFCQYNTFSTCFGRGHPDDQGVCTCFDPLQFASKQCNKRADNTTVDGLVADLTKTLDTFGVSIAAFPSLSDIRIESTNTSVDLVGTYAGTTRAVIVSLAFAIELNEENNCHGNGRPVGSDDLAVTDCQCLEEYRPRKTCTTKIICTPGQYIQGDSCSPCPAGFFCDNGISAQPCPNGTFTTGPRSFACYEDCIAAGFENSFIDRKNATNPAIAQCIQCQVGNSCDGITMTPCPAGTFGSRSLICIPCNEIGLNFYANSTGSLACSQCPTSTSRLEGSGGTTTEECVCLPGTWNGIPHDPTKTGVPCMPCPSNAICDGYVAPPDNKTVPISRILLEDRVSIPEVAGVLRANRRRGLQVNPPANSSFRYQNARPFPADGFWGDPINPSAFFECDDSCIGGANYSCETGYQGKLCSICAPGFHMINGACYVCPDNQSGRVALVVFGITGILLLFVTINRASNEVRALDIALLYTQVVSLIQQFSFVWPPPVDALNNIYAVTNFDIDFVTFDCAIYPSNNTWNFVDKFYTQWFFVWYVGAFIVLINLIARSHSRRQEQRQNELKKQEADEATRGQLKRAATAAARIGKFRSRQSLEVEGTGTSPTFPLEVPEGAKLGSTAEPKITTTKSTAIADPSYNRSDRSAPGSVVELPSPPTMPAANFSSSSAVAHHPEENESPMKRLWRKLRAGGGQPTEAMMKRGRLVMEKSMSTLRSDDLEMGDPRIQAIKSWLKRTFGMPNSVAEYEQYSNGQIAGWLNLIRIMYNSLLVICLNAFGCMKLADGSSVLQAWPETLCFTSTHTALVVIGSFGVILYGFGFPAFVFGILSWARNHDKKADRVFQERFGFLFLGYKQDAVRYQWELVILFRRFVLCVLVVSADGYPYIQAVCGAFALVVCLGAHLFYLPYDSSRTNVLESVVLASAIFYLVCGTVFTGLNDLAQSRDLDPDAQAFAARFSTVLSYILLVISVLTVLVCFIVFFMDLQEYFHVLMVERALIRKAKSEDVALIRVLRAEVYRMPSTSLLPRSVSNVQRLLSRTSASDDFASSRRSSKLGAPARRVRRTSALFDRLDQNRDHTLSREELLKYTSEALKLPKESCRARIDELFAMFDLDASDSVDLLEFYAIIRSAMPITTHCELKRTIKPRYLIEWAEKTAEIKPLSIALFFELDESLRSYVADDGPLSVFRDNTKATFFRTVAKAFPFLIDWLASAPQDQVDSLKTILSSLNQCRDALGPSGSFGRMTVEIDRAPVIAWMLETKAHNRAIFRAVFKAIADANTDHGRHLPFWGDDAGDIEAQAVERTMPILPKRRKTWASSPESAVSTPDAKSTETTIKKVQSSDEPAAVGPQSRLSNVAFADIAIVNGSPAEGNQVTPI